jgi:hypothetical protein
MEVIPAQFARMAGVSRPSVSGKIANKTLIVNSAGMLDTENPVNAAYLAKHRQKETQAPIQAAESDTGPPESKREVSSRKLSKSGPNIDDYKTAELSGLPVDLINMSIRELIRNYPGLDKIERYVKIYKEWTAAQEKELRIQERNLTLIPKDFVIARLFTFVDTLAKESLEYPEKDVEKIIAIIHSRGDGARNEIVKTMKDELSRIVAGAKEQIITELNNLKSKYQNDNMKIDRLEEIKEAIEEARDG